MEKEILEYWNSTDDIFPDIIEMSKMFGLNYEKICDILFKEFVKIKHIDRISYNDNKWFKNFDNPYTYSLIKKNNSTTFKISDENINKTIWVISDEPIKKAKNIIDAYGEVLGVTSNDNFTSRNTRRFTGIRNSGNIFNTPNRFYNSEAYVSDNSNVTEF